MDDAVRWRDRLGTRLGLAFMATAVVAVASATVGAWVTTRADLGRLVASQRTDVVDDVAVALVAAYTTAGGWDGADLLPAHTLAASAAAVLVVTTTSGEELPVPAGLAELERQVRRQQDPADPGGDGDDPGRGRRDGGGDGQDRHVRGFAGTSFPAVVVAAVDVPDLVIEERWTSLVVDGTVVGTLRLLFTDDRLDPAAVLQRALMRNLGMAGLVAAGLGLAATAFVLPRLTRPVRHLTTAVTAIAGGDWHATARLPVSVGELAVLARSVERMAADLEREDRLRRNLVADVAHEVRTPLTVLLGEVEALQDGVAEPDPAHLASLHEEVLRLARLVEDLEAIAAAEAAGRNLRREVVDLADVTATAMAGLEERARAVGAALDAHLAPAAVFGDRRRLEQIVRNLLTNATRFSPTGGRITVLVSATADDAVLQVTDDGPGIPAEDVPHVFERFWRGEQAQGTPGSGVGLAVVAELTAAHGGQATAGNAPGRGAQLTVRLPRIPSTS